MITSGPSGSSGLGTGGPLPRPDTPAAVPAPTTPARAGARREFDAVLCDVDNVIRFYDTSRLARLERAAGLEQGTTEQVAYAPEVDLPLLLGRIGPRQWVSAIAEALGGRVPPGTARELGEALAAAPSRVDPDVVSMLRRVRQRVPVVLVSNGTSALESDLVALGLGDFTDRVVNSARVGVVKPEARIYGIAAARAGVAASRCLFVDDRAENAEAAGALGMSAVRYRSAADLRAALGSLPRGEQ